MDENRFDRTRYNARIDLPSAVSWVSPWSADTDLSRYSTRNSVKSNIDAIELNALFVQVVVRVVAKLILGRLQFLIAQLSEYAFNVIETPVFNPFNHNIYYVPTQLQVIPLSMSIVFIHCVLLCCVFFG